MAMSLDDIKNFIEVSKTLNVTRASERVGITQPAMSYSLKRLEREVGGDLLIRLKRGVKLTKFGETFLSHAGKLHFEWLELEKLTTSDSGDIVGNYTLGAHPSVALYTFEHFIDKLYEKFPKITLNFTHGLSREMTEKVINWDIDFAIVVNPKKHPDLIIKEICKDKVMLFGVKGHAKRLITDLQIHQTHEVMKKMKKSKQHYDVHMNSENLEVVAKLASLGLGAGILPTRVAKKFKELKPLDKNVFFEDRVCLVYRPEKAQDKVGREIKDLISKVRI